MTTPKKLDIPSPPARTDPTPHCRECRTDQLEQGKREALPQLNSK